MSMTRKLNYFLGLQIEKLKDEIFICQSKYTKELLKKFEMEKPKLCDTPMSLSMKLDLDESAKKVEAFLFREMIGSILYLTAGKLDIMFRICMCAHFQSNPILLANLI